MSLRANREKLARNPTESEQAFYRKLVDAGVKFEFQHIIGPYIVDFLLIGFNLVVEIDGSSHDGREAADAVRDADLISRGYKVKRIRNEQVEGISKSDIQAMLPTLRKPQLKKLVKRAGVALRSRISRAMGEAREHGYGVEFFLSKGFTPEQASLIAEHATSRKGRVEFLRSLKRDCLKETLFTPQVTLEDITKFKQRKPKERRVYLRGTMARRVQHPTFGDVEMAGSRATVNHRGPLRPPV